MDAQGNILADTVGQQRTFWVYNFASETYYKLTATCKKVGIHSYIYLEDGKDVSDAVLTDIVNEFDDNIYPTDTFIFCNEPNPGADNVGASLPEMFYTLIPPQNFDRIPPIPTESEEITSTSKIDTSDWKT